MPLTPILPCRDLFFLVLALFLAVQPLSAQVTFISSVAPFSAAAGTSVTIAGNNFRATESANANITAVVGNAASGSVGVANAFGTGSTPGYIFRAAPIISSFAPTAATPGAYVQIYGTGFTGATAVSFGSVPAQNFIVYSDMFIAAQVSNGASGNVTVTTATGTNSLPGFTFLAPPIITTITPDSGFTGTTVSIIGSHFTGVTGISFGGVPASSFTILTDTSINAVVGNGASGSISITGQYGTASGGYFTYLGPDINSFTPQTGGKGTIVNIYGANLTGVTAVKFGGTPAASFSILSDNSITAVTDTGSTGDITVISATGIGTRGTYTAPPRISSFAPLSGPVGTSVTINGNSFSSSISGNKVYLGGVKATITAASSSSLTITVPAGASYSPLVVTANGLSGYSTQPFTTTFTGGPLIPAFFAMRQLINAATPLGAATGDLNNDGKPELVTANANGSLSVYRNNSTEGNMVFAAPLNYAISANNYNATGVVIEDFTGDGNRDIAIINYGSNIVSVFRNSGFNGSLSFAQKIDFATGNKPTAIATGDMDGDGKPDMLLTNYNSQTLSVYRNIGTFGSVAFAPKVDYVTGVNPDAVTVADFDKDGRMDIAVANEGSASVSIFRNTGSSGTLAFAARADYTTGAYPSGIAVSDFDADGGIDLVLGNSVSVSVFRNSSVNGIISFDPRADITAGNGSNSVNVNDIDGDGKPDIAAIGLSSASVSILKNIGSPGNVNFAPKVDYPLMNYPAEVITADMDGDSKPDIIAMGAEFAVLRNKVNEPPVISSFSPMAAFPGDTIQITGKNFTGVTALSFGGAAFNSYTVVSDKIIRAITGIGSSGDISLTTPYGTATLAGFNYSMPPTITSISPLAGPVGSTVTISGSNFSSSVSGNKVSFGTAQAIITAASSSSITVLVPAGANQQHISVLANGRTAYSAQVFSVSFPGAGSAFTINDFDTTTQVIIPGSTGTWGLGMGDIDGDSKTDLAFTWHNGSSRYFSSMRNTTNNNTIAFAPKTDHLNALYGGATYPIIDINQDGKPDVFFQKGTDASPVTVFKNNSTIGAITLQDNLTITYSSLSPYQVCAADIDADGRADIIIKSEYGYQIVVCRNTSINDTLSFAAPQVIVDFGSVSYFGGQLIAEDFSGDGRPDLALITQYKVTLLKNTGPVGSIAFGPALSFTGPVNEPARFAQLGFAADIDGDGKMDIAKSNSQDNSISVLRNNSSGGNISFEAAIDIPTGFAPQAMAIADMDGDGKPEICVNHNSFSGVVAVFKNTSTPGMVGFAPKMEYPGKTGAFISLNDIDNDGKPEIITANNTSDIISILRNKIGEPVELVLCPPAGSASISSDITGAAYQWQVNTGSGFTNIADNANYGNTNTATLQLINAGSSWYGNLYRCVADGANSRVFVLKFGNRWNGAVSTDWSNPANWTCGTIPDANTDVIINSGTVVINANVTINSLSINTGASLTVGAGYTLTILH